MSRAKVLVSIDPDVLAIIDKRATQRGMTRSGYIVASAMGLIDHAKNPDGTMDFFVDVPIATGDTLEVKYDLIVDPLSQKPHPFREYMEPVEPAREEPGSGICAMCGFPAEHTYHAS